MVEKANRNYNYEIMVCPQCTLTYVMSSSIDGDASFLFKKVQLKMLFVYQNSYWNKKKGRPSVIYVCLML